MFTGAVRYFCIRSPENGIDGTNNMWMVEMCHYVHVRVLTDFSLEQYHVYSDKRYSIHWDPLHHVYYASLCWKNYVAVIRLLVIKSQNVFTYHNSTAVVTCTISCSGHFIRSAKFPSYVSCDREVVSVMGGVIVGLHNTGLHGLRNIMVKWFSID